MNAKDVIAVAKSRGVTLSLDGDRIKITGPPSKRTKALLAMITAHRDAIIKELTPVVKPEVPWRRIRDDGLYPGQSLVRWIIESDWLELMNYVWPMDDLRHDKRQANEVWRHAERVMLPAGIHADEL